MPLATSAGDLPGPLYAHHEALTILRDPKPPENDPAILALQAVTWIVSDEKRAQRFLELTGLAPDDLRAGLHSPAVLGAGIDFLLSHEPDLIAAAMALEIEPIALVRAGERLRA